MSDRDDERLDEWMRAAAAKTEERLNAMDDESHNATAAQAHDEAGENDLTAVPDSAATSTPDSKGNPDAPPQLDNDAFNDQIAEVPIFAILTEPESSETAPKRGRWEVVTEASRYLLDLDRELLRRFRGSVKPSRDVAFPAKLRDHDRGWVRLLRIVQLEVGKPAVFDIESLGGPEIAFTRRETTYVLSIRQLSEGETFD